MSFLGEFTKSLGLGSDLGDIVQTAAGAYVIYQTGGAVGGAAASAASAYGGVTLATAVTIGTYARNATMLFLLTQTAKQSPSGPVSQGAAQGMLLNVSSNVAPIPVVYGVRTIGGTLVFAETAGEKNEYLGLVIALCEGDINRITGVYIDDVSVTDPRFEFVQQWYANGYELEDAPPFLKDTFPHWTAEHRGNGVAWLGLKLKYSQKSYSGFPQITVDVEGKKVFDPRSGTTIFSSNPALCIRDYLTNSRYGRGISSSLIDDASIISAADYCDEFILMGTSYVHRYTCNGVVDVDQTAYDNIKSLLTSCRGMLIYSGGLYKLVIDKPSSATYAFTEDNITGGWSITQPGRRSKFNRVTASFYNPAENWQPDLAIVDSSSYRAQDNGLLLETKIDLPFTYDAYRAQILAGMHLKQSRFGIAVAFRAFQAAMRCEVGDVVSITHSTPGWVGKLFRVNQITMLDTDEVEIVAIEYDASVYNIDTLTAITSTTTIKLPDIFDISPPTSLVLSSGTDELLKTNDGTIISRIKCAWGSPDTVFVTQAEIQYQIDGAGSWQTFVVTAADQGVAWIPSVQDGVYYNVRIRFLNTAGVQTDWAQQRHLVVGKTMPPANVASLTISGKTLSWPAVDELDLDGYRIKFQYGTNLDWGTASQMHVGLVTDSPYTMLVVPPGNVTIMVRAVDTSGNESAASAYVITDLGNSLVSNVVESYDFKTANWPGSYSNATVSGGNLTATQTDPFYSADEGYFYGPDAGSFYSINSDSLTWMSGPFTPSFSAVGSNMTLAWTITGNAYAIEYRRTGPLPFYGADASIFYAADASSFYTGASDWATWPGSLTAENQEYQFRVSTESGAVVGVISAFTVSIDVPDKTQKISNVVLSSVGTRLSAAAGYFNVIQNVQLTLQGGSTAMSLEITDKSAALGPLVIAKNSAGTGVAATVDAFLQGY